MTLWYIGSAAYYTIVIFTLCIYRYVSIIYIHIHVCFQELSRGCGWQWRPHSDSLGDWFRKTKGSQGCKYIGMHTSQAWVTFNFALHFFISVYCNQLYCEYVVYCCVARFQYCKSYLYILGSRRIKNESGYNVLLIIAVYT